MGKLNGTLYVPYDEGNKVLWTTEATLTVNVDLPDVTNKDSAAWAEHIDGCRDWSIDFSGLYDESGSGYTADEILADIIARTADTTKMFKPTTGATKGWSGEGTYQNIKISAPKEGGVTFSGSIKGNGALALIV